ncbi:MAG: glutamate-5-semialdehyde dehydrogenase [Muribaculum sp.]|nr:glutamate-5-semialdehyde dehydrogenase [Muribaculum sp.]
MNLNETFTAVRKASSTLLQLSEAKVNDILLAIADEAVKRKDFILAENAKDLALMPTDDPKFDRLRLTADRIKGIASDIRHVASLPSPLVDIEGRTLPNGLRLTKRAVPFGVIGIIYEARPNVSFDVASLCLKSGNATILKGGSDADHSNRAIVNIIHAVLDRFGIPREAVTLLPSTREATSELLHARGFVDLLIPRGSASLITYVRENARIPVIETGAGVCHAYFDKDADLIKGRAIVNNAKTRRVSVCNALDCLLVDSSRISELPELCSPLKDSDVIIYADARAYEALESHYPEALLRKAHPDSFGTEFLSYAMSIKTVDGVNEAIDHIARFGSGHSESIVTENPDTAHLFTLLVDAACVYVNAPTSFTDGAQFGLGAEIGISTQKLHARGPMALREITTYKWIIQGNGQIRPA